MVYSRHEISEIGCLPDNWIGSKEVKKGKNMVKVLRLIVTTIGLLALLLIIFVLAIHLPNFLGAADADMKYRRFHA